MKNTKSYTIKETAKLSGLPESTLRYYETIGLIHPIKRDTSSKHRFYSEQDVNHVIAIACLNATEMSIEDMRTYLKNRSKGKQAAGEQVDLLEKQKQRMVEELHHLVLRQKYIDIKISYWKAVRSGDVTEIKKMVELAHTIAKQLKLPDALPISK